MAGTMLVKMACVMVVCMVVLAPHAEAAVSCGQVTSSLLPCLNYLRGGAALPANCCSGVKGLNGAAKSTADKKTACGCLKNAYSAFPGIKPALASGLPGKCGVSIPYKISPTTDCNKIQ